MGSTCIISKFRNAASETFIQAHVEFLQGEKVFLNGHYPHYTFNNREIRLFYGRNRFLKKIRKLLPHYFYERLIIPGEFSQKAIDDYIAGFFHHHQVEVILAEYGFYGADICPHARALKIPMIVHFHGHDAHNETDLAPFKDRYGRLFDYAFRIISVSHFMTKKLVSMGADPAKIVYNPYGPRDTFFAIQPVYSDMILAIGRFTDIKAPYLTVLAFKLLLDEFPGAHLMMVGDGPLRETCISLAQSQGITTQITFTGAIGRDQIEPLLTRACCFVQHSVTTSYGDAEGTPVAILEAGAAGLPVVSTRHAGITDAVIHGQTGFLVEERDVVGMKNYLRKLIEDKTLCRNMGEKAREHIRQNYSIKRHIACIQNLIDEARGAAAKESALA